MIELGDFSFNSRSLVLQRVPNPTAPRTRQSDDEKLENKAARLGFEEEVAQVVGAEAETNPGGIGGKLAAIVAEEGDEGIPLYSPAPQEPELTPEQEEAKRKLDSWYVTMITDYKLVRNVGDGELPVHLDRDNLYYTYQVYLDDIQNGTKTIEDINMLGSGDAKVIVPSITNEDLETNIYNLSNLGNWLISDKPELVKEHLAEGEEFDPSFHCSKQLPDDSTSAMCLAALEAAQAWQNRYDRTIVAAVIDPAGPWGGNIALQPLVARVVKRLILNESQFDPTFVDPKDDATGLGQIQPGTWELLINNGYASPPPYGDMDGLYGRKNPDVNIRITLANLTYLYDNIKAQNEAHADLGWDKMEDVEILKFAVALHNSGPDDDFGTGYRIEIQSGEYKLRGECFDPTLWECFKLLYKHPAGERTIIYVDNIFADDMNLPPNVAP